MTVARVAVFGGSFNPPHVAHVFAAVWVLSACEIDRVLVVPCFVHPFAKSLAPFQDRFEMCRIAFERVPDASVSRVEQELGGESKSLRTLRHLAAEHPDWKLRLVVGADVIAEAPRWEGFDAIRELAPPIMLGRAGTNESTGLPEIFPAISSTRVREAIENGRIDEAREFVPRGVLSYVLARGLYGTKRS